jgi:hypothetical protein
MEPPVISSTQIVKYNVVLKPSFTLPQYLAFRFLLLCHKVVSYFYFVQLKRAQILNFFPEPIAAYHYLKRNLCLLRWVC